MRTSFSLLTLTALAGAVLTGCNRAEGENAKAEPAQAPTVPVARLAPRDTLLTQDYTASIQALRNVEIRSLVGGQLSAILVDEGQTVRKGQPLFRLNDAQLRTQLASARAALDNAQAQARVTELDLKRIELLTAKKIISSTELESGQAKLRASRAEVAQARAAVDAAALNLSYTTIRAPFDGVVDRIPQREGSAVEDGTLLTTISDTRGVFAYFTVSENEYLRHEQARQADRPARLLLANGTEYAEAGRVETVQSEFEATTGSITFRARFPNPQRLLRHGATGKVRLTNTLTQVLLVPQTAVFEVQDNNYVYVVEAGGTIRQQAFVPQARLGNSYVVAQGLKVGDRIVCEGTQDLKNGDKVTARALTPPAPVAGL